jgi:hypothetical protein
MKLVWEHLDTGTPAEYVWRTKVPGGWFIFIGSEAGSFFYPDPQHKWDGNSLP